MNSRLGFELLPDLASLPRPPKVVVQLHVEEQDRSGYVRLRHDAVRQPRRRVLGHEPPSGRRRRGVRHRAASASTSSTRGRRRAASSRPTGRAGRRARRGSLHVLYPGRLVEQKDPLLMVEVAAAAARPGPELPHSRRRRGSTRGATCARGCRERGLDEASRFHPPTQRDRRAWYRGVRRAADDERLRGRAVRHIRGDGDGPARSSPRRCPATRSCSTTGAACS